MRIKESSTNDLKLALLKAISTAYLRSGQQFNKNVVEIEVDNMTSDVVNYFGALKLSDIELAFKNGIQNKYGEYFGLNIKTYLNWLKNYIYDPERVERVKLEQKNNMIEEKKLSEKEKEEIIKNGLLATFERFKENKPITDAGNINYKYLVENGIFNLSRQRKLEIRDAVQKRMIIEIKDRNPLKTEIKNALKEHFTEDKIISECRLEALKIYFKELVEMEMDIKDLLNE